jgi:hypothetical protein
MMSHARLRYFAMMAIVVAVSSGVSRGDEIHRLNQDNGPFMVLAYSFRGPDAEVQANTLLAVLDVDHKLPAYVLEKAPETFEVYVGNCQTNREAFDLMKRVRKIQPQNLPRGKGKGLSRAIVSKNPLANPK